jgi:hypothetical protein
MARGSIVKRGGSYSIVYYVDGRQRWKSLGSVTRKEAERHLREILNEIQDGTVRDLKPISFREYAKKWLERPPGDGVRRRRCDSCRSWTAFARWNSYHALNAIARPSLRCPASTTSARRVASGRNATKVRGFSWHNSVS